MDEFGDFLKCYYKLTLIVTDVVVCIDTYKIKILHCPYYCNDDPVAATMLYYLGCWIR
jgi:hypothetical protein